MSLERDHPLYTVDRRDLYKKVKDAALHEHIKVRENPFDEASFPLMKDINFSLILESGMLRMPPGTRIGYDKDIERLRGERFPHHPTLIEKVNKGVKSVTAPRLYNVLTGETIATALPSHLYKDLRLVIKVVDLGAIYSKYRKDRDGGDDSLNEIYNEIRVGFFLNELRYAYENVATNHFMTVLDWFVSDKNLYPEEKGKGPFQYIVSEKLDTPLYTHLVTNNPDMYTLMCTLFQIAQALEAAWTTHHFIHYDLHHQNIMMKAVVDDSLFHDKAYLYTRPYDDKTYRLATNGTHNMLVKVIDFGRNNMRVPDNSESRDLFEHIDGLSGAHEHNTVIKFEDYNYGLGINNNRTWDTRRIMWDLMVVFPSYYWRDLKLNSDNATYEALLVEMKDLINMVSVNRVTTKKYTVDQRIILFGDSNPINVETVLFSPLREMYLSFTRKRDRLYVEMGTDERRTEREKRGGENGFNTVDELDEALVLYDDWEDTVIRGVVWTSEKTQFNATTFLSSPFFKDLIVEEEEGRDTENNVWVGQRAFEDIVLPNLEKTYLTYVI